MQLKYESSVVGWLLAVTVKFNRQPITHNRQQPLGFDF
jgi:hypothetical protein